LHVVTSKLIVSIWLTSVKPIAPGSTTKDKGDRHHGDNYDNLLGDLFISTELLGGHISYPDKLRTIVFQTLFSLISAPMTRGDQIFVSIDLYPADLS
jgi:hypothetical protein